MLRKKLRESISARIFLITALLLSCTVSITFGLIAWATPMTYTAVANDDLMRRVDVLIDTLSGTALEDCGPLLGSFARSLGADVVLEGSDGQAVDMGLQHVSGPQDGTAASSGGGAASHAGQPMVWPAGDGEMTVTTSGQDTIAAEVRLAGEEEPYTLYVSLRMRAENLAVRALVQMAPWLFFLMLALSLLCAFAYSRYMARPIVRLSGIAEKIAGLDFSWECRGQRQDEIGKLEHSLDQMSKRLSAALAELEDANAALRGEVGREQERERRRTAFFSAASHELKTPITILKGQLSGMLEGVGIYKDRDKYLLRSLQVAGRMEKLVQEMLAVSRMETSSAIGWEEPVELASLVGKQLELAAGLFERKGQRLAARLEPGIVAAGNASLLGKAIGNLLSNASAYSPEGAEVRVWCGLMEGKPAITIENTGAHIGEEALPHLFEPFYREESSRNRATGGSGLGLYLVQMILSRQQASCVIENTEDGVRAAALFREPEGS